MATCIRRRDFVTLIGGAASWPPAARAQPERMRRVGILMPYLPTDTEWQSRAGSMAARIQPHSVLLNRPTGVPGGMGPSIWTTPLAAAMAAVVASRCHRSSIADRETCPRVKAFFTVPIPVVRWASQSQGALLPVGHYHR